MSPWRPKQAGHARQRGGATVIFAAAIRAIHCARVDAEVRRVGFTERDHVSSADQTDRYLKGRSDTTAPVPNFALALFAK